MCGIVGMSFRRDVSFRQNEVGNLRKMFTEMLVNAQNRGSAATGVILVGYEGDEDKPKVYIARSPLCAKDFVTTKEYKQLLDRLDGRTLSLVGHTRAPSGSGATAADNKNNHPFVHGPIIGIHNGRIVNDDDVWKALSPARTPKSECDSEAIFGLIDYYVSEKKMDTESAIAEAIDKTLGWMAIATINAHEPHKVYLFRDKESPLEVAFWSWLEVAIFSSQYSYIEKGLEAGNFTQKGSLKRLSLDPQQLVSLDSTLKGGSYAKLFTSSKRVKEDKAAHEKVLSEHKSSYETTQGR